MAHENDQRREERLNRKVAKPKQQPDPAKNVGDDTANPLPDDPDQCGGKSGDAGRT
jgi:hypothetical protein